jgi:hypothetical protein
MEGDREVMAWRIAVMDGALFRQAVINKLKSQRRGSIVVLLE